MAPSLLCLYSRPCWCGNLTSLSLSLSFFLFHSRRPQSSAMVGCFNSLQFGILNLGFGIFLSLSFCENGICCIWLSFAFAFRCSFALFFPLYKPLSSYSIFLISHFHKNPLSLSASSFIFALFLYYQSRCVSMLLDFTVFPSGFLFLFWLITSLDCSLHFCMWNFVSLCYICCVDQSDFMISLLQFFMIGFLFIGYFFCNRIRSSF